MLIKSAFCNKNYWYCWPDRLSAIDRAQWLNLKSKGGRAV